MKQEDKELLIKDLCARLPYGVKAHVKTWSNLERGWIEGIYTIRAVYPLLNNIVVSSELGSVEAILGHPDYFIKPYLFPLSSMTEEQKLELTAIKTYVSLNKNKEYWLFDWFNANHIDWRGLIPKGLAIDCTNLNIY